MFNPLVTSVLYKRRLAKILISISERNPQKNSYEHRDLRVGRRKEPILSYVTGNYQKNNSCNNGLMQAMSKSIPSYFAKEDANAVLGPISTNTLLDKNLLAG